MVIKITKSIRIDDLTHKLIKSYADRKDISISKAHAEIVDCPCLVEALSQGEEIPLVCECPTNEIPDNMVVNELITPQVENAPITPQVENAPITPQVENAPITPQVENAPITPQVGNTQI